MPIKKPLHENIKGVSLLNWLLQIKYFSLCSLGFAFPSPLITKKYSKVGNKAGKLIAHFLFKIWNNSTCLRITFSFVKARPYV